MKLVSRKGCGLLVLGLLLALGLFLFVNRETIQRMFLGGLKVYETQAPAVPADLPRPAILVFSKTNGFRHEEAIPAANALFTRLAADNGWGIYTTENGAAFSPEILSRFDAVVFNNVSGDVFTPDQRQALKDFIENGGGFVGFHGSGGDNEYAWTWYVDELIGAQFIGHPMDPQFQQATLRVEDKNHPATATLPDEWVREDEWYSFAASPRRDGYHVLMTIDEGTYRQVGLLGADVAMNGDHPMAWWHCQGRGRAFFSALGHKAEYYAEPQHVAMLLGATRWALRLDGEGCDAAPATQTSGEGE
jgi:uncharacterized protein